MTHESTNQQDNFLKVNNPPAVKILVLDGGGLRGCMSIQILKRLEKEINSIRDNDRNADKSVYIRLGDVFDMIVGTSTGGLIALALGKATELDSNTKKLRTMTCEEVDDFYDTVAKEVFYESWTDDPKYYTSLAGWSTRYDTDKLEKVFKNKLGTKKMVEIDNNNINYKTQWLDEPFLAVISTMTKNYKVPAPVLIRNYDITGNTKSNIAGDGYNEFGTESQYNLPGLTNCYVWQAARATTAAPTYFAPILIKIPNKLRREIIGRNICILLGLIKDKNGLIADIYKINDKDKQIINQLIDRVLNVVDLVHKDNKWVFWKHEYHENDDKLKPLLDDMNGLAVDGHNLITLEQLKYCIRSGTQNFEFVDGGVNANSPCLLAYSEAKQLWPKSDIKMLSVGTGKGRIIDQFVSQYDKPDHAGSAADEMFASKEYAALMPLMSLASQSKNEFDFSRWNPQIDPNKTEMSDKSLMNKVWRPIGNKFANDNIERIKEWAHFLYNEYKYNRNTNGPTRREEINDKFYERQAQLADARKQYRKDKIKVTLSSKL